MHDSNGIPKPNPSDRGSPARTTFGRVPSHRGHAGRSSPGRSAGRGCDDPRGPGHGQRGPCADQNPWGSGMPPPGAQLRGAMSHSRYRDGTRRYVAQPLPGRYAEGLTRVWRDGAVWAPVAILAPSTSRDAQRLGDAAVRWRQSWPRTGRTPPAVRSCRLRSSHRERPASRGGRPPIAPAWTSRHCKVASAVAGRRHRELVDRDRVPARPSGTTPGQTEPHPHHSHGHGHRLR